jgi:hypothetical protein
MRRIFLSYHHQDELEAEVFCRRYEHLFDEIRRLGIPDEDEEQELADRVDSNDAEYVMRRIREKYIAGTSCTVVLIGKCTWARRYVDWEIAATLRNNKDDPRGGLIAVQLRSAAENGWATLPPRLQRNIIRENGADVGYARFYAPPPSDGTLTTWVEEAIKRGDSVEPVEGSTSDLRVRSSPCE